MEFRNNLTFDEILLRYAIMLLLGITAGVLHQFWMIIPTMFVFLEAIMGWCPIKQMLKGSKA
ncbi:MAG: hypothetical protein ACK4IY_00640 [Chitinophagales bacterium]